MLKLHLYWSPGPGVHVLLNSFTSTTVVQDSLSLTAKKVLEEDCLLREEHMQLWHMEFTKLSQDALPK